MTYDIEFALSCGFADYMQAMCSTQPGQVMDTKVCPIVTFYDPMSVDDANRMTIMVPNAATDVPQPGRFVGSIDMGLKTIWTQPTIKSDFANHRARLKDIRDKLLPADLLTRLAPYLPNGMAIDFVHPQKRFTSHIAEAGANWIYSGTIFEVAGYFTAEA